MPRIFVKTLGCKVNNFDSNALENQLIDRDCQSSESMQNADITIINTCSVTENAEKEARYLARRYKRENPDNFLVVTGCYAQVNSSELNELKDIDFIIPNEVKENAAELLLEAFGKKDQLKQKFPESISLVKNNRQNHFKSSLTLFDKASSSKTRAVLKIQDGCDGFCSYCLIPYARGSSRSVNPDQIIAEMTRLVNTGVKEFVISGIHIGDYGKDLDCYEGSNTPVVNLIERILQIPDLCQLRISSLEPVEVTEDLIELLAANRERVCNHFHLPMQAGCDRVLKVMNRKYTKDGYRQAVLLIRKHFPDANIGADVIPGFPGEADEEFEETYEFIKELELSYLHVFPYSKRPNTAASRMPNHLPIELIKARSAQLRLLSAELESQYNNKFIGEVVTVLWENEVDSLGRQRGHSRNYMNLVSSTPSITVGAMNQVKIKGRVTQNTFLATPI